jgi:hypothetical protein
MMVTKFGLSEKIGAIYIDNDTNSRDGSSHAISGEMQQLVDKEIKRLLDESYQRVLGMLTHNRHKLENIAAALMQYETLSGSEIVDVINSTLGPNGAVTLKNRSEKPSREMKVIPLNKDRKSGSGGSVVQQPTGTTTNVPKPSSQPHINKQQQQPAVKNTPVSSSSSVAQQPQKPLPSTTHNNNNISTSTVNNVNTRSTSSASSVTESTGAHHVATSNGVNSTLTPPPSSSSATSTIGSLADYFLFGKSTPAKEEVPEQPVNKQHSTSTTAAPVTKNTVQPAPAVAPSAAVSTVEHKSNSTPVMNTLSNSGSHQMSSPPVHAAPPARRIRGPPVIVQEAPSQVHDSNSSNKSIDDTKTSK